MRKFDIGRNTLRLYEDMGLLTGMKRTDAGYREYSEQHVQDLKFIIQAKDVGFTLNEIKSLLSTIRDEKKMTCGTVSAEIAEKVQDIESEMRMLESKKIFLQDFLGTCTNTASDSKCDVVTAGFTKGACCN